MHCIRRKYTVPGVVVVTSLVVALPLGSDKSSLSMVSINLDHLLVTLLCTDRKYKNNDNSIYEMTGYEMDVDNAL